MDVLVGLLTVLLVVVVIAALVLRSLVRAQFGSFGGLLSTPSEIVESLLVTQKIGDDIEQVEFVVLEDGPALRAFLIDHVEVVYIALGVLALFFVAFQFGSGLVLAATVGLLCYLGFKVVLDRIRDVYTRYVMTNFRVIRITGILHRENFSIPWGRVTDFAWDQNYWARLLGFATIRIVTASEESGLKELKNLGDPVAFNAVFVRLVQLRQGMITINESEDVGWLQDPGQSQLWSEIRDEQAAQKAWTRRRSSLQRQRQARPPTRWR